VAAGLWGSPPGRQWREILTRPNMMMAATGMSGAKASGCIDSPLTNQS